MEMKHLPIILTAVLSLSCFDAKTLSAGEKEMEITSSGIENGRIEDKYGKRGDDFINNVPSLSLPLIIHNAPPGTKSFALILRDEDAAPVVGYPWIHWLAANIRGTAAGRKRQPPQTGFYSGRQQLEHAFLRRNDTAECAAPLRSAYLCSGPFSAVEKRFYTDGT